MSPHMMDRDQRYPQRKGHGFCKAEPHQYCTDQAGSISYRHGINILPGTRRLAEGLLRQCGDHFYMLAGCNLRHYAAIKRMHVRLGGNGIGEHFSTVLHHCHSGLVAGGFKRKDLHWDVSPLSLFIPGHLGQRLCIGLPGNPHIPRKFLR